MLIVGGMKSTGYLRHYLSPVAGGFEVLGSILLILHVLTNNGTPPAPSKSDGGKDVGNGYPVLLACYDVLGLFAVLAGLGVIISTDKRKSTVCWTMAAVNMALLRQREGHCNRLVLPGLGAIIFGFGLGNFLNLAGFDIENVNLGKKVN